MIKILIMDDSGEKISRIRSVLTKKCLVDNKDIDEARSLNSGRVKLAANFYDLLLLDLILPVGDNEDIEPGKSENFINELYTFGRLKKPIYVIGLSQYEEKVEHNQHIFENKLWKLIHYNLAKDDWEQLLQNAVDSILSTKEQLLRSIQNNNNYDFGIICALSEEFEQMKDASGLRWEKFNISSVPIDFFRSEMRTELGHTIKLVAARNNMAGMQAISAMASCMYTMFGLHVIFMTGICAGFKKDENDTSIDFGDIFIAESEYDYGSGKLCLMNDIPILKPDPKMLECDFDLKGKINTFIEECKPEFTLMSALRSKNLDLIKKTPQLHFAPGACGSYVVANKEFMKGLIKTYRKIKGLDMEGYGLYMAAHMLGRKALLIKGVSDFADSDKGDAYHRMCSYSSACFLFEFLKFTY